jgi:hypothetical protein
VLAVEYVALGATALGRAGALGIVGGVIVLTLLAASSRISTRTALGCLVVATLPFAALTWWSIVTPIIALLLVTIGALAILRNTELRSRTDRLEFAPSGTLPHRPEETSSKIG